MKFSLYFPFLAIILEAFLAVRLELHKQQKSEEALGALIRLRLIEYRKFLQAQENVILEQHPVALPAWICSYVRFGSDC
jgi:hypothetical protein